MRTYLLIVFGLSLANLPVLGELSFSLSLLLIPLSIQSKVNVLTFRGLVLQATIIFLYFYQEIMDNPAVLVHLEDYLRLRIAFIYEDRQLDAFFIDSPRRNALIFARYIAAIAVVLICFRLRRQDAKMLNSGFIYILGFVLFINIVFGIASDDYRLTGFFGNTGDVSMFGLILVLNEVRRTVYRYLIIAVGGASMALSMTLSGFIGLLIAIAFRKFMPNRFRTVIIVLLFAPVVLSLFAAHIIIPILSEYMYIGSLANRFEVWTAIMSVKDPSIILFGMPGFPVFADNIFLWIWQMGGMILSGIAVYILTKLDGISLYGKTLVVALLAQGSLYGGAIGPENIIAISALVACIYRSGTQRVNCYE